MRTAATHPPRMPHVAFELGNTEWTLGVATHLEPDACRSEHAACWRAAVARFEAAFSFRR
jgi:hypothetical protein